MKTFIGYRFSVQKHLTTKSINVGSCDNLHDAEKMMIDHYENNSKRGNYYYTIWQEEMNDYDGYILCSHSLSIHGGKSDYYKKYLPSEIKEMVK